MSSPFLFQYYVAEELVLTDDTLYVPPNEGNYLRVTSPSLTRKRTVLRNPMGIVLAQCQPINRIGHVSVPFQLLFNLLHDKPFWRRWYPSLLTPTGSRVAADAASLPPPKPAWKKPGRRKRSPQNTVLARHRNISCKERMEEQTPILFFQNVKH